MNNNNSKTDFNFIYFLLVCLLALVVLAESLMAMKGKQANKSLLLDQTPTPTASVVAEDNTGIMSFVLVNTNQVQLIAKHQAQLIFNSLKTPVGGLDAILIFDPKVVNIKKITANKNLFNQFVINEKEAASGRIKITAYSPKTQLTGIQTFATLDIEYLTKKTTAITYEYSGTNVSADSNLISQISQKDILGKVIPLEIKAR